MPIAPETMLYGAALSRMFPWYSEVLAARATRGPLLAERSEVGPLQSLMIVYDGKRYPSRVAALDSNGRSLLVGISSADGRGVCRMYYDGSEECSISEHLADSGLAVELTPAGAKESLLTIDARPSGRDSTIRCFTRVGSSRRDGDLRLGDAKVPEWVLALLEDVQSSGRERVPFAWVQPQIAAALALSAWQCAPWRDAQTRATNDVLCAAACILATALGPEATIGVGLLNAALI